MENLKWILALGLLACGEPQNITASEDDCWESRKTEKQLTDEKGVIFRDSDWEYIETDSTTKLFPCNLPDSLLSGDTVIFSAEQKETLPNERWAGKPIKITAIAKYRNP